jgi:hypothetical protein
MKVSMHFLQIILATSLLGVFSGCEYVPPPDVTPAETACTAGQAQIQVSDGYLEILCGCAETPNTIVTSPGTLKCTVPVGTTVFFLYLNTHLEHQIISTGGIAFASGPPHQPGSFNNMTLAVPCDSAGTSDFEDAFDSDIQGQIVIQ